MGSHIGKVEFIKAALPGPQNFTAAAQFQIFFGNQKTVFGLAHGFQPLP